MNCLLNGSSRKIVIGICAMICCAMIPVASMAAEVDVYAEGAYTDTELKLYIYADITPAILSFGVRVDYPAELSFTGATKNEEVWYFGDGTTNQSYMAPENDGSSVIIIGGKIDTSAPKTGVSGERVLLGTATFSHNGLEDFSGITLTYGRGDGSGDYKNFVDTEGTVKDGSGVSFAVNIVEGGDANADGNINSLDAQIVRGIFFGSTPWTIFADCNGDNKVNSLDAQCIRNKFFN